MGAFVSDVDDAIDPASTYPPHLEEIDVGNLHLCHRDTLFARSELEPIEYHDYGIIIECGDMKRCGGLDAAIIS